MEKSILSISIFLIMFSTPSIASFIGPQTVVQGICGKGDLEFGCGSDDIEKAFFWIVCIDENGNIILGDPANLRIKIYNSAGVWQKNISYKNISPGDTWPDNLRVKANVGIFSVYDKLQKYDYNGNLNLSIVVPGVMDFWVAQDGGIWLQQDQHKYIKYSPNGDLLKTYTDRPLELGVVTEIKMTTGQYKYVVKYPDKTWEIIREGNFSSQSYIRDLNGNLYGVGSNYVVRYDDQGKEVAKLTMPKTQYKGVTLPPEWPKNAEPPRNEPLEEYGAPIVAPNGDVYTWKRTPDKYYIIKWVWQ